MIKVVRLSGSSELFLLQQKCSRFVAERILILHNIPKIQEGI